MAEYNEYKRRQTRQHREKKQHTGYAKKLARQLIISTLIFAFVCTPWLPSKIKETAKYALNYSVDTEKITSALNHIFENMASKAVVKNEEITNEDTKQNSEKL